MIERGVVWRGVVWCDLVWRAYGAAARAFGGACAPGAGISRHAPSWWGWQQAAGAGEGGAAAGVCAPGQLPSSRAGTACKCCTTGRSAGPPPVRARVEPAGGWQPGLRGAAVLRPASRSCRVAIWPDRLAGLGMCHGTLVSIASSIHGSPLVAPGNPTPPGGRRLGAPLPETDTP